MPMAVPILAGGFAIAEGLAATGIISGLLIAGGALTIAGAVTGSKTLQKWGAIAGLAGGVGMIVDKLGTVGGSLAGAAGEEAAKSSAQQALSQTATAEGAAAASTAAETAAQPFMTPDALQEMASSGSSGGLVESAMSGGGANAAGPIQELVPTSASTPPMGEGASPTALPSDGFKATGARASPLVSTADRVGAYASDAWNGLKSGVQSASDWMSANKELTRLGGGLIGGAMQSVSQQRLLDQQMKAQEEALARERARYSGTLQGLRMPTYQPPVMGVR